jgi:serine O-acetyltransferase
MLRSTLSHLTLVPDVDAPRPLEKGSAETLWARLRQEAEEAVAHEPTLAPLFFNSILNQPSFEAAIFHRVASRLGNEVVRPSVIADVFRRAASLDPEIGHAVRALPYFKGFHAIQAHRVAHWLWTNDHRDFALYLQSRSSDVFQTDIHPAAPFGRGIFLDHATGLVVGATAVVEDDVSILQNVTLGGTGKEAGERHPKIRRGAMIGAGAKILGNIEIGACARVAAGSVVLRPVAANTTVAGVPARVVGTAECVEPARTMDQILHDLSYEI